MNGLRGRGRSNARVEEIPRLGIQYFTMSSIPCLLKCKSKKGDMFDSFGLVLCEQHGL